MSEKIPAWLLIFALVASSAAAQSYEPSRESSARITPTICAPCDGVPTLHSDAAQPYGRYDSEMDVSPGGFRSIISGALTAALADPFASAWAKVASPAGDNFQFVDAVRAVCGPAERSGEIGLVMVVPVLAEIDREHPERPVYDRAHPQRTPLREVRASIHFTPTAAQCRELASKARAELAKFWPGVIFDRFEVDISLRGTADGVATTLLNEYGARVSDRKKSIGLFVIARSRTPESGVLRAWRPLMATAGKLECGE